MKLNKASEAVKYIRFETASATEYAFQIRASCDKHRLSFDKVKNTFLRKGAKYILMQWFKISDC